MKKETKFLLIVFGVMLLSQGAFAAPTTAFASFQNTITQWFTGSLGYIIAIFAFVGAVILYAFTHKHSILFIGFLIAFFAGAGVGIAKLSFDTGSSAFSTS